MNTSEILASLELLRSWAPGVLRQGAEASQQDLHEIIKLRTRLDSRSRQDHPALFFQLLRVDMFCEPHCATLLYLDSEEVRQECGSPNPLAWHGVHDWSMVREVVDQWASQMGSWHQAEVVRAFCSVRSIRGGEFVNNSFLDETGAWVADLGIDAVREIKDFLTHVRTD